HLVHIGALSFEDALRLVEARGTAFDAGPDGAMAIVSPIDLRELEVVVERARVGGLLEICIYNSARQHTLSGDRRAVEEVLHVVKRELHAGGVIVEPRLPMHSKRYWPVVPAFIPALQRIPWRPIMRPYLPTVSGRFMSSPTPGDLIYSLALHVWRPV